MKKLSLQRLKGIRQSSVKTPTKTLTFGDPRSAALHLNLCVASVSSKPRPRLVLTSRVAYFVSEARSVFPPRTPLSLVNFRGATAPLTFSLLVRRSGEASHALLWTFKLPVTPRTPPLSMSISGLIWATTMAEGMKVFDAPLMLLDMTVPVTSEPRWRTNRGK